MPLGATPSRWCVCQFHHFRAATLLYFQLVAGNTVEGLCTSVSIFVTTFCATSGRPKRAASGTKSVRTRVRLTTGATHGRLDVIVARRVLQREGAGTVGRLVALLWALRRTQ